MSIARKCLQPSLDPNILHDLALENKTVFDFDKERVQEVLVIV